MRRSACFTESHERNQKWLLQHINYSIFICPALLLYLCMNITGKKSSPFLNFFHLGIPDTTNLMNNYARHDFEKTLIEHQLCRASSSPRAKPRAFLSFLYYKSFTLNILELKIQEF